MVLCILILGLGCVGLTTANPFEENDAHGRGCWSSLTGEILAYDTRVFIKCKQYICTPEIGLDPTGVVLEGCSDSEMLCWDWMIEEGVSVGTTLYHRCQQYQCTAEDWTLVEGADQDPRCAGTKKGCKIHHSDETAPYGTKGYFKCEQFECTSDGFQPTGVMNPACTNGKGACWDWYKNEAILVGAKFYHNCSEYECIDSAYTDVIPTEELDPRCTNQDY